MVEKLSPDQLQLSYMRKNISAHLLRKSNNKTLSLCLDHFSFMDCSAPSTPTRFPCRLPAHVSKLLFHSLAAWGQGRASQPWVRGCLLYSGSHIQSVLQEGFLPVTDTLTSVPIGVQLPGASGGLNALEL